jgi:hypothetical protein
MNDKFLLVNNNFKKLNRFFGKTKHLEHRFQVRIAFSDRWLEHKHHCHSCNLSLLQEQQKRIRFYASVKKRQENS